MYGTFKRLLIALELNVFSKATNLRASQAFLLLLAIYEANSAELQNNIHYFAIENLENSSMAVLRGRAGDQGYAHDSIILPAKTHFREWILEANTLKVAVADYTTPADGNRFQLPEFHFNPVDAPDT